MLALGSTMLNGAADIFQHGSMVGQCILGPKSPVATCGTIDRMFHAFEIVHHASGSGQGQGIIAIEISP
jgi:hypothetical protein